jgi:hypothetical protein
MQSTMLLKGPADVVSLSNRAANGLVWLLGELGRELLLLLLPLLLLTLLCTLPDRPWLTLVANAS